MEKALFSSAEIARVIGKGKHNLKKLESELDVALKISRTNGMYEIAIKSTRADHLAESLNEYIAVMALDALAFGFSIDTALLLKNTDYMLRKIDIKAYAKGKRVAVVKGRIIGKGGKTKALIEQISGCSLVLKNHLVGILGEAEAVEASSQAVLALIRGAPQSKVYARLEGAMTRLEQLKKESIEEAS